MNVTLASLRTHLHRTYHSLLFATATISPTQLAADFSSEVCLSRSDIEVYSAQQLDSAYPNAVRYIFTVTASTDSPKILPKTYDRLLNTLRMLNIHFTIEQPQRLSTLSKIASLYKATASAIDLRIADYSIIRIGTDAVSRVQLSKLLYVETPDYFYLCIPSYYSSIRRQQQLTASSIKECFLCCLSLFKMSASDTYNEVMEVMEEKWEGVVTRKDVEEWEELNAGF